jgi:transposase
MSQLRLTQDSIIVGIDVHKYAHTAVALDCFGQEIGQYAFTNDQLEQCVGWLQSVGTKQKQVIGLEDLQGNGNHLAKYLLNSGYCVYHVPAVVTDRLRKHSVHRDKSDVLDAGRVGKAILTQGESALPAVQILPKNTETIKTLDLLVREREDLVGQQTELKNQLHALMHQHYGNGYRQAFKTCFSRSAIAWYTEDLAKITTGVAGSIVRHLTRLTIVQEQIKTIDKELTTTSQNVSEVIKLMTIRGCGLVTACKIMAEIKTIQRFTTESKLAKYAGIAPTEKSSAGKGRLRTNPFGNRKLNRAIHTIALSQLGNRGLPEARNYFTKKCQEGKSKLWAIRCLKRQVIKAVFAQLTEETIVA